MWEKAKVQQDKAHQAKKKKLKFEGTIINLLQKKEDGKRECEIEKNF